MKYEILDNVRYDIYMRLISGAMTAAEVDTLVGRLLSGGVIRLAVTNEERAAFRARVLQFLEANKAEYQILSFHRLIPDTLAIRSGDVAGYIARAVKDEYIRYTKAPEPVVPVV